MIRNLLFLSYRADLFECLEGVVPPHFILLHVPQMTVCSHEYPKGVAGILPGIGGDSRIMRSIRGTTSSQRNRTTTNKDPGTQHQPLEARNILGSPALKTIQQSKGVPSRRPRLMYLSVPATKRNKSREGHTSASLPCLQDQIPQHRQRSPALQEHLRPVGQCLHKTKRSSLRSQNPDAGRPNSSRRKRKTTRDARNHRPATSIEKRGEKSQKP